MFEAIAAAESFRIEGLRESGELYRATCKTSHQALVHSNSLLKRRGRKCETFAVLPSGEEVRVGIWTQTDSIITEEERQAGREAFADELLPTERRKK